MAKSKKLEVYVPEPEPVPLRLDIGCGNNKREGFIGIDRIKFDTVDIVMDVRSTPWGFNYADAKAVPDSVFHTNNGDGGDCVFTENSVDEVHSSHFLEHLDGDERVAFMNELYRVMKVGATAQIVTPCWQHSCAYGDPTHKWPPVSQWTALYFNKAWRDINAPHTGYTCDFDYVIAGSWDQSIEGRNPEYKQMAMNTQLNAWRDIIFTLTKRAPG